MDKINSLASIIIPVYKVEQYLCNCIESVINQSYTNWELILVDDGSPDKCGEICDEYAARDKRIQVIHKENGGQSSARNAGLDLPPSGEFVTFLDSDDFWHHEYLETLMDLQQKFHADLVQCGFIRGTESVFPQIEESVSIDVLDNHEVFLKEKANVIMWGKLYRTSMFDGIRMPVGLYNEDDWTAWKLYYRAKTIVVTNQSLYYYTINPNSTMGRLGKKPDLRYINAYNERIGFFIGTGEKDLEHCSRLQLCKSLLLTYRNKQLSEDERNQVKAKFDESWKVIKSSPYIRPIYKVLFQSFRILPLLTSTIASKLK
jgi:glycosyltransferase involved in cell wall biosynthesis